MTLSPSTRLGPYEIVSLLGEGGMGRVYRARDTQLGRDVAIKILPEEFAADPDRLMRFEREARTLAALNHPHIAHVYGLESSGASRAIVMELVEGEDLADRIARGPMPLDDAIAIGRQIADALESAHDAGIVHRDLKPANVNLTRDGRAKVGRAGHATISPDGRFIADVRRDRMQSNVVVKQLSSDSDVVILPQSSPFAYRTALGTSRTCATHSPFPRRSSSHNGLPTVG